MLEFVDELAELVESVPLLVVCCARPELLERRPDWGGGKRNALTVSLGPLSRAETEKLVESLLGRDPADDVLRASVVERAAGNPLYAEEFVRMQASGGATSELPDSVLGIVAARVDLLPPAEKELLRDAAVMGTVVWSDGLRAVSGRDGDEEVGGLLRSLGRKEFLRRERQSAVAGATQHAFVHGLVRDAVYAQLPRPDRVERHVRVARWIETLPEDRREDRSELLAHHYVQAIELSRSAGLDAAELQPAAAAALREAGLRAFAVGAPPACVRALRAAASWSDGGLDAQALRVLGKALVFTEQSGREELPARVRALPRRGLEGRSGRRRRGHRAFVLAAGRRPRRRGVGGARRRAHRGRAAVARPRSRPRAGGAARDAGGPHGACGRARGPRASRSRRRSAPRRRGRPLSSRRRRPAPTRATTRPCGRISRKRGG